MDPVVLDAPAAVGPYSQAIKFKDLLFVSGNIPLDPATGEIVAGGIEEQAEQALKNLRTVVEASGSDMGKVVKTTVRPFVLVSRLVYLQFHRYSSNRWATLLPSTESTNRLSATTSPRALPSKSPDFPRTYW